MSASNLIHRLWRLYSADEFGVLVEEVREHDWKAAPPDEQKELLYLWAMALWRMNKPLAAYRKMRRLLRMDPAQANVRQQLAGICCDLGRFEESDRYYASAQALMPESSTLICEWASMLYQAERADEALFMLADAKNLCAMNPDFYLQRAYCWEEIDDPESACGDMETYLSMNNDPSVKANLGNLYVETGEYDRAEKLLRDAVQEDSEGHWYLYDLAQCLRRKGELDEAESLAFKFIDVCPDDFEIWGLLGDLEMDRGNFEHARERYEYALKIHPSSSSTLSGLARLHYHRGDVESARELSLKALSADSGNSDALALLRELRNAPSQRLCCYTVEIHGAVVHRRFCKTMECFAETPEDALAYVEEIQQTFAFEIAWEVVGFDFVDVVDNEQPGVSWISPYTQIV